MAISAAALALVVVGTTAVAANHEGDGQRGPGRDRAGAHFQRDDGARGLFKQRGERDGRHGPRSRPGSRLRAGIGDMADHFVRRETTVELEDGVVTRRVDNGTVTAASDTGLDYTLATGENAAVTTDEDTKVVAFTEQTFERRGHSRTRLAPQEVGLADVEAGSQVVVWAQSQDDGTFLAQRIVIRPMLDETGEAADSDSADIDAAAVDDATVAPVTEA